MLGAADIEGWDEDVRGEAIAALCHAGWDRRGEAPTYRLRRLLDHFRAGRSLSTGELAELRRSLVAD